MPSLEESFCAAEERALRFLTEDYGFRAVERSVTPEGSHWMGGLVRYEVQVPRTGCPPVGSTVSLSYAPARLELSMDISDQQGHRFSVEELHTLETGEPFPHGKHGLYDSANDEQAQFEEFTRLATALRKTGTRFFGGDQTLWSQLAAQRARFWEGEEDRRAVATSEIAFREKNWAKVVAILEPRQGRLSKASIARLALARKRLQSAA